MTRSGAHLIPKHRHHGGQILLVAILQRPGVRQDASLQATQDSNNTARQTQDKDREAEGKAS